MMQKKSHMQHHLIVKIFKWLKITLLSCCVVLSSAVIASNTTTQQPKPSYYRFYDAQGRVTISRNVSPDHIRHGYEVLDRNMYLIKKVPAYNVQKDLSQSNVRASQLREAQQDQQIKRSYRNVKYATEKKEEALKLIQKQVSDNYLRMKQLQSDRAEFLTKKADLIFNKQPIPTSLQNNLDNNEANIKQTRQNIEMLKTQLAHQDAFYNDIINRLQKME